MWGVGWSGIREGVGYLKEVTCEDSFLPSLPLAHIMDRYEGVEDVWGGQRLLLWLGREGDAKLRSYLQTQASEQARFTCELACHVQGAGGDDAERGRD